MRAILLVLALCAACAVAQVEYASRGGPGGGQRRPVRRRRIRQRRPRPEPQLADEQTLVPFLQPGGGPPSREQFQSLPAPPSFQQQGFRPQQDFGPPKDFRPQQGFRPQQDFGPPKDFRPQQDFQPEFRPAPASPTPKVRPSSQTSARPSQRPSPKTSPRPSAQPKPSRRAGSRFKPQEPDYVDYQPEAIDPSAPAGEEDYVVEEEPDRLSVLLEKSSFRCDPADTGYFADDSVNCEVFHYCSAGVKHSWVCPNGNSFHQINLICQPQSSDNICKRSEEFHFVNDYLYQQINNDSLKPQYADRYYPDSAAAGDVYQERPAPQASYDERQPAPVRRRRPQTSQQFGPSGNGFGDGGDFAAGFRQPQSSSVLRPTQQARRRQRPVEDFDPAAFRRRAPAPQSAESAPAFDTGSAGFQRRGDQQQPLPPVRPPSDPYPDAALRPAITFRGAPRPAQERRDQIVLGGFQGHVDIEDLASRRGRQ